VLIIVLLALVTFVQRTVKVSMALAHTQKPAASEPAPLPS
jgi:biopolymer transport protein ExbD